MSTSEIATVLAWHDALNTADLDTLVALSSDDIEIGCAGTLLKLIELSRDDLGRLGDVAAGPFEGVCNQASFDVIHEFGETLPGL